MGGVQQRLAEELAADMVPSPCVGVCKLDPSGLCVGCLRTAQEIAAWRDATNRERRSILLAVDNRRRASGHDIIGPTKMD